VVASLKAIPVPSSSREIIPARVVIVGAGEQALTNLIPSLQQMPEAQIVAVCDADLDRASSLAAHLAVENYATSMEALLDSVNATAIIAACPPQAHEDIIRAAARCRVPVFVEKPPASSLDVMRMLTRESERAGLISGVGMNFRHAQPYAIVKELLKKPEYGQPISVSVRFLASKPRQAMWGLSFLRTFLLAQVIHPLDLMLDIGGKIDSFQLVRIIQDGGILLDAQLRYASGAAGSLLCGTCAPRFAIRVEIVTDRDITISLSGLSELVVTGSPSSPVPGDARAWSQHWRPSPMDAGFQRTGYFPELAAFLHSARQGTAFHPELSDLLPTYELLDELERRALR
jgi:phthalate 4,5-cis-dihydrodiol dehydrogenase